ncbi:PfkB family carbohydrate kinase [Trichothermofontia sp.]
MAKLGIPTAIVGRVGTDSFRQALYEQLSAVGVAIDGVGCDASIASGVALIVI